MENKLSTSSNVFEIILHERNNNFEGKDNLDKLPEEPAIYAICARINGESVNCRYVGEASNLRQSIKKHFTEFESHPCLAEFMQSIKIKSLRYSLVLDTNRQDILKIKKVWEENYKPECNKQLNKVH